MNVNEVKRLAKIVDQQNWAAYDGLRASGETVLDALGLFLSGMDVRQRKLSLDILERYLIIKEYSVPAKQLLERIVAETDQEQIFISTVKDFGSEKVKSGASLSYEFSSLTNLFPQKNFSFFEDPTSEKFLASDGFCVLVDDFIGSGNQFLKMLTHLDENDIAVRCDCVAALIFQDEGRLRIEEKGYSTVHLHSRPKCLHEIAQLRGVEVAKIHEIYDAIEASTCCNPDYNRGYSSCEASVTLKKTPNNTLPIFWHEGRKKWPAPFPRPKN
jgi:hypothetical protein